MQKPWFRSETGGSRIVFIFILFLFSTIGICSAGKDSWDSLGPAGTYVRKLVIDPSDSKVLYAATFGEGIQKSTDGGRTWTASNYGLRGLDIDDLAIDPIHPNILYADASGEVPLYVTQDGGHSWTSLRTSLYSVSCVHVTALTHDPIRSQTLYIGCSGTANGAMKSTDGGLTWRDLLRGRSDLYDVTQIVVDPENTQNLYISAQESVLRSNNGGQDWAEANSGLPRAHVSRVVLDRTHPRVLYAVVQGNVYKSINAGKDWLPAGVGMPPDITVLLSDPNLPDVLYAGTGHRGVYRTLNGGKNWVRFGSGLPSASITALAVNPQTSANVYAGTNRFGIYSTSLGQIDYSEFYFPQVADGGGYETTITLVNPDNTIVSATMEVFQADGTPLPFPLGEQKRSIFYIPVWPFGTVQLPSSLLNIPDLRDLLTGWIRVTSRRRIQGSILYGAHGGSRMGGEAGIDPAVPLENFHMAVDTRNRFLMGVAIANPGDAKVDLLMTLYGRNGDRRQGRLWSLEGRNRLARQIEELFPQIGDDFLGTLSVETIGGPVTATTLRYSPDLSTFSSIPVNHTGYGPSDLYFAHIADGGGYKTILLLLNAGNSPLVADLEIMQPDGTPWPLALNGTAAELRAVSIPAHGLSVYESSNLSPQTVTGWARVARSNGPLTGSVVYAHQGQKISEAGINPSFPANQFRLSIDTCNGFHHGLAIANPNGVEIQATLTLLDDRGRSVGQSRLNLGAWHQVAMLENQLFPEVSAEVWQNFIGSVQVQSPEGFLLGTTLRFDPNVSFFASTPVF